MEQQKRIDLLLNENIPVAIELTRGNITILSDNSKCFVELEYSNLESITPEILVKQEDKNLISFKNTEIISTNAYFYLPSNLKNIEIHIIKGDITIYDMNNNLNLQTDKGDIKIKNCRGNLNATTLEGNIKIYKFEGETNLNSPNGTVKILDYQSNGGNIQTNTGSIIIGLKKISKDLNARSNYGKISIGLTKDSPCTVIARATEVIKYINNNIKGENLGSPAEIKWENGGNNIQLFSANNKILISKIDNLSEIAPDFEDIFKEFETGFKDLSKKMEKWGKNFAKSFQNFFSDFDNLKNNKQKNENNSIKNERMEILNMLKEGKITAEEAEKLLKALK